MKADSMKDDSPFKIMARKYGVSEARGCTLVSEVLEKRLLVPCEEHEIPPMDVDLTPFLKDSTENED